jgi:hypothetical protein
MSDDNVTSFPVRKRLIPDEVVIEQRRAQEVDRDERKRQLSKALEQNQWLRRRADRIAVAQRMNDLLISIEKEHGIRPSKILQATEKGIASKNKREYAIPKGLSPKEEERLDKRLKKGTRPYVNIINAVVKLAPKLRKEDLLFEVFGPPVEFQLGAAQEQDDGFEELASRLRFVADAVSARYDLSKYFRDVEKAGVSPNVAEEGPDQGTRKEIVIKFSSENKDTDGIPAEWYLGWPIELRQFTCVCGFEEGGDLPAYPMVILGAWEVGGPFPVSVSVAQKDKSVEGRPVVVLSFCIVPTGKERSATPALRVDLCASIFTERSGWARTPLTPGRFTVGNYEINITNVPKLSSPFTPADIERHASAPHWRRPDILFLPIDDTVCRNWFKFEPGLGQHWDDDRPIPHPDLWPSLCLDVGLLAPFSPFGADTLAGIVDAALWTGTLNGLLEEQTKRLTEAFDASRKAAAELRERGWETVKEQLKSHDNA